MKINREKENSGFLYFIRLVQKKKAGVTSGGGNYYCGQHCGHSFVWLNAPVLHFLSRIAAPSNRFVVMIPH